MLDSMVIKLQSRRFTVRHLSFYTSENMSGPVRIYIGNKKKTYKMFRSP